MNNRPAMSQGAQDKPLAIDRALGALSGMAP